MQKIHSQNSPWSTLTDMQYTYFNTYVKSFKRRRKKGRSIERKRRKTMGKKRKIQNYIQV